MVWFSVTGREPSLSSAGLLCNDHHSILRGTVRRLTYKSTFNPNKVMIVNIPQELYAGTDGICVHG